MGRIKDLFIELQNKYGENMEDLPAAYLRMGSREVMGKLVLVN